MHLVTTKEKHVVEFSTSFKSLILSNYIAILTLCMAKSFILVRFIHHPLRNWSAKDTLTKKKYQ